MRDDLRYQRVRDGQEGNTCKLAKGELRAKQNLARFFTLWGLLFFGVFHQILQASELELELEQPIQNTYVEQKITIDIPSQPLAQALILFSIKYQRIIVGQPKSLANRYSTAVKGQYNAHQALTQLLIGTGLNVEFQDDGGFVVMLPAPNQDFYEDKDKILTQKTSTEEMLILGRERGLRPQKNHSASSYFNNDFLIRHNVDALTLLSTKTPNFSAAPHGDNQLNITLRGLGSFGGRVQSTASVPVHLNGRYVGIPESINMVMFDVADVEVLAGPQITEPGRSGAAGAVYINSKLPRLAHRDGTVDISLGNYGQRRLKAAINLPVLNNFALRLAMLEEHRDGYTKNQTDYSQLDDDSNQPFLNYPIYTELENTAFLTASSQGFGEHDNSDKSAVRISALWKPGDSTQVDWQWQYYRNNSNPVAFLDPYIVNHYKRAVVTDSNIAHASRQNEFGVHWVSKLSSAVLDYRFNKSDFSSNSVGDGDLGRLVINNDFRLRAQKESNNASIQKQQSHNLELYNAKQNLAFGWLFGMHFSQDRTLVRKQFDSIKANDLFVLYHHGTLVLEPDTDNQQRDIYAQFNYDLSKYDKLSERLSWLQAWRLDIGARAIENHRQLGSKSFINCTENIDDIQVNALISGISDPSTISRRIDQARLPCSVAHTAPKNTDWHQPVYDISLKYTGKSDWVSQWRYATGFRAGEIHNSEVISGQSSRHLEWFVSDSVWNTTLDYQLNWFHTEHKDMLFWPFDQSIDATHSGLELRLNYQDPWQGSWQFSAGYLDARIDKFADIDEIFGAENNPWNPVSDQAELAANGYLNLAGNRMPNAPKYSTLLNYKHRFNTAFGRVTPEFQFTYIDTYYLDMFNRDSTAFRQSSTGLDFEVNSLAKQPAYYTLDFVMSWATPTEEISATLGVYNMTNEAIRTGIREDSFDLEGFQSVYARPRTWIIEISLTL